MLALYLRVQNWLNSVIKNEEGQAMPEYALIIALIAVVAILALTFLGTEVSEKFSQIGSSVGGAGS